MTRTGHNFETSTGTLYVSKPYKSKSSKKLRALITFTPRNSTFDTNNEASSLNEFRGFFSLFWISIFIFTIQTFVRSVETEGRPLSMAFASLFSQHALPLALTDLALVSSTTICVPYARALQKGRLNYYWTGVIIQHLIQTTILATAVVWTYTREWPWVQSGFLTLHTLVMVMKMHSYMNVNGHLQTVSVHSAAALKQLEALVEKEHGPEDSWQKAIAAASRSDTTSDDSETASGQETPALAGTPAGPTGESATVSSYVNAHSANALRKRLATVAYSHATNGHIGNGNGKSDHPLSRQADSDDSHKAEHAAGPLKSRATEFAVSTNAPPEPHPLVHHPNVEIAALAEDYSDMQSELTSRGPRDHIIWPRNITWKNFAEYMLIPSLVYELEYPRTGRIRPWYLLEKIIATFGTFALLYTVTDRFILPYTPTPGSDQGFLRTLLDLACPFMVAYLLLFYIMFDCICNGFAELSCFADRQFYEDWWNSTSWDEFSRKWNKPVHTFLLRHVYAPSVLSDLHMSKTSALLFTFTLSAAAHELVMSVVTRKIRPYLFTMQLIQIPLIFVGRIPAIKRNKVLGNIVFWLGLYAGFPMLCVAYVAY